MTIIEPLHKEDIKASIRKKGITLKALALANNLSESAIRVSLIKPFPKADRVIAKFLCMKLNELWPYRYDQHQNRIKSSSNSDKDISPKINVRHRKKCGGK